MEAPAQGYLWEPKWCAHCYPSRRPILMTLGVSLLCLFSWDSVPPWTLLHLTSQTNKQITKPRTKGLFILSNSVCLSAGLSIGIFPDGLACGWCRGLADHGGQPLEDWEGHSLLLSRPPPPAATGGCLWLFSSPWGDPLRSLWDVGICQCLNSCLWNISRRPRFSLSHGVDHSIVLQSFPPEKSLKMSTQNFFSRHMAPSNCKKLAGVIFWMSTKKK